MTRVQAWVARGVLGWVATVLLAAPVWAQQKMLSEGSEIVFTSRQMGVPVEGKFKKFEAQVQFDPKQPEAGQVHLRIDMGSATIGVPETDVELPKPVWFNVAKFPQAHFTSSGIKRIDAAKYEILGKLSIKGQVQNMVVPVTLTPAGAHTLASGEFTIKRLAFKIGEQEWSDTAMVADDVKVKFKLALTGVGPS